MKTPVEALDDFLDLLRREFRSNPELAHRAVEALGVSVELRGTKAADVLNPLSLVAQQGADGARQTLSSFSANELKKIAKNGGLATSIDMKDKDETGLVELIIQRATNKISERNV